MELGVAIGAGLGSGVVSVVGVGARVGADVAVGLDGVVASCALVVSGAGELERVSGCCGVALAG